jgi:hypothetical protein
MKLTIIAITALLITSCTSTGGVPDGAVAWCGNFEYTGTWTKSQTGGRALGVSDATQQHKRCLCQPLTIRQESAA